MEPKDAPPLASPATPELTEEDVLAALKEIPGYLDITPGDFRTIYQLAYRQALVRLSQEMTAAAIMTRKVVAVPPEMPLSEVAAVMGGRGISGVPVADAAGRVLGVISEKDFLRLFGIAGRQNFMTLVAKCLRTQGSLACPISPQTAAEFMTAPALVVEPESTVAEISELFQARGINRAPVVDKAGRLMGIVSRADLLRAYAGGVRPC